jgi:hypothetical protein
MQLDIRIPIGLLFTIIGLILTGFGIFSEFAQRDIYEKSLGINVNLWWGLAMVAFGVVMLGLAWRARGRQKKA